MRHKSAFHEPIKENAGRNLTTSGSVSIFTHNLSYIELIQKNVKVWFQTSANIIKGVKNKERKKIIFTSHKLEGKIEAWLGLAYMF